MVRTVKLSRPVRLASLERPLVLLQAAPAEVVLDATLDSKVLYQSSASVDRRHVGGTYHYFAGHNMEVEDRIRRRRALD